ncbi:Heavy metal-associated domain containing protein [Parasponia andersonii]|uniref:Heavy metal-associated domain containing protein n=1 Tax=Parasponia andersonii TaxID=3476 RepID=A0A2P5B906_PARAD|nr:Heavy metal-associated domain containing protein [Parasponia andersonii]
MCNEVVLKVYMHCEGCKDKVSKCLRGFDGVEDVVVDTENHKVIVRGKNVDPIEVLGRLRKKYSRNAQLFYPIPKPENKEDEKYKEDQAQLKFVVLKVSMHCQGCADDIKKYLERMRGVLTVEPNMEKSMVIVRGIVDPSKLVQYIKKRLGKNAEILKQETGQANCCKKEPLWDNKWHCPPFYSSAQCICPSDMFSDENPFACCIM